MTSEDFLDSDEPGFTSGLATTFGYEGNFGAATHRIDVDRSQVVGLIGPMNISPYIEWTSEHLTYLFDARVKENRSLEYKRELPNTKADGLKELSQMFLPLRTLAVESLSLELRSGRASRPHV